LARQNCQPADRHFHGETAIADDNPRRPFVRQIPPTNTPTRRRHRTYSRSSTLVLNTKYIIIQCFYTNRRFIITILCWYFKGFPNEILRLGVGKRVNNTIVKCESVGFKIKRNSYFIIDFVNHNIIL